VKAGAIANASGEIGDDKGLMNLINGSLQRERERGGNDEYRGPTPEWPEDRWRGQKTTSVEIDKETLSKGIQIKGPQINMGVQMLTARKTEAQRKKIRLEKRLSEMDRARVRPDAGNLLTQLQKCTRHRRVL